MTSRHDFYCDHCGKCCLGLGATIAVLENPSPGVYRCRNRVTGESWTARGEARIQKGGSGCPFFRQTPSGSSGLCMIYADRPLVCRQFRCYDLAVVGLDGKIIARVKGTALTTKDTIIQDLFESVAAPSDPETRGEWLEGIRALLAARGYRVVM